MPARLPSPAATLATEIHRAAAPDALVRARVELAGAVVGEIAASEPVVAGLVVGSTALRRCAGDADLDVVVITDSPPADDHHVTRWLGGTRVEIERRDRRAVEAATTGDGWVWELREAARLGCSIAVHDPTGFAPRLATRAAAMAPTPERVESTLRELYLRLIELARAPNADARWADALRGCLDNLGLLALLEHPRRYQKPKWALADLVHAGELDLVDATLAAHGTADAVATLTATRSLVAAVYDRAGIPRHEEILAMGYAPQWAEASYVSRTLADAEDLAASGRATEARYVAAVAARLAAGLLADDGTASTLDTLEARGGPELAERYLALFPGPAAPPEHLLNAALAALDARRATFEARLAPPTDARPA